MVAFRRQAMRQRRACRSYDLLSESAVRSVSRGVAVFVAEPRLRSGFGNGGLAVVYRRATYQTSGGGFGLGGRGSGAPAPRDIIVLMVVLFVTYSMQFFKTTAVVPWLLQLTPNVFLRGWIWQLATYPFTGFGGASVWFLLTLLMIFWFGRDAFYFLGRRRFWRLLVVTALVSGVVAAVVQLLMLLGGTPPVMGLSFSIMQGQGFLLAFLIAVFANVMGEATILLFFVLPLKARWFIWIEILFAFITFLSTRDLAGFLGICTTVGVVTALLGAGGPRGVLKRLKLRLDRLWVQIRLARLRSRRRFDVIDGDDLVDVNNGKGGNRGGNRGGSSGWRDKGGSDPGRWVH